MKFLHIVYLYYTGDMLQRWSGIFNKLVARFFAACLTNRESRCIHLRGSRAHLYRQRQIYTVDRCSYLCFMTLSLVRRAGELCHSDPLRLDSAHSNGSCRHAALERDSEYRISNSEMRVTGYNDEVESSSNCKRVFCGMRLLKEAMSIVHQIRR